MTSAVMTSPMRISFRARLSSNSAAKLSAAGGGLDVAVEAGVEVFIIRGLGVGCRRWPGGSIEKTTNRGGPWRLCCPPELLGLTSMQLQHFRHRSLDREGCRIELDGIRGLQKRRRG